VYLLDSDVEGNEDWQKRFTHVLYDATPYQRAVQEMILGIGGVRFLEALGYTEIETYHMNEGHASMLTLELLNKFGTQEEVRRRCVFTTHTPVPAGHDKFDWSLMLNIFRDRAPENFRDLAGFEQFNTTILAINFSRYVNGVARKHGEVTREMFPEYAEIIDSITNGIHVGFWVAKELRTVYNKFLPGWHVHPSFFNRAMEIDPEDLWQAHWDCKKHLIDYEKSHSWILLDKNLLTIGYARRITQYKRPLLLFNNLEKLAKISKGKVQYVFAGKCHPKDNSAKDFIKKIHEHSKYLWDSYRVRVAFLENYDMDLSHLMVSGVDVWLNTPKRYQEASGTSGMKAAANAVPNFSVLDGWWIEGYEMDPLAGWKIGPTPNDPNPLEDNWNKESSEIYNTLDQEIIPLYYSDRNGWVNRMKHSIKLAAYFNTHRQVYEYAAKAYLLEKQPRWKSLAMF
jgi:starch phosphorylase